MLLEHIYDQFKKGDSTLLQHLYSTFRQPFVTQVIAKYDCPFDHAILLYQSSILILYDEIVRDSLPNQKTPVISYLLQVAEESWEEFASYPKVVGPYSTFDHLHLVDRRKKIQANSKVHALKDAMLKMNDPHRQYLENLYFQDPPLSPVPYLPSDRGGDVSIRLWYESIRQLLNINS